MQLEYTTTIWYNIIRGDIVRIKDLKGKNFNRLTVLEMMPKTQRKTFWKCLCHCGKIVVVRSDMLQSGNTKSCGCWKREVDSKKAHSLHKHKMSDTKLYKVWQTMKDRCNNPKAHSYNNYGGRGIKICKEWTVDFKKFADWALQNGYKERLTIDRIDVNGNYKPSNCRWVDNKAQANNRTTNISVDHNGEKMTLMELSELLKLPYTTIYCRYKRGDRGDRLCRPYRTNSRTSKLSVKNVRDIKLMLKEGNLKQSEIAVKFNVNETTISCINTGKTWSNIKI